MKTEYSPWKKVLVAFSVIALAALTGQAGAPFAFAQYEDYGYGGGYDYDFGYGGGYDSGYDYSGGYGYGDSYDNYGYGGGYDYDFGGGGDYDGYGYGGGYDYDIGNGYDNYGYGGGYDYDFGYGGGLQPPAYSPAPPIYQPAPPVLSTPPVIIPTPPPIIASPSIFIPTPPPVIPIPAPIPAPVFPIPIPVPPPIIPIPIPLPPPPVLIPIPPPPPIPVPIPIPPPPPIPVPIPVPPPPPPSPTVQIFANPSQIAEGGSSVITWHSANATHCIGIEGWSGLKPVSGSEVVRPHFTTNYGIVCLNSFAQTHDIATVHVISAPPPPPPQIILPTVDIQANPTFLNAGQSSVLSWTSTNASFCTASGGWSGNKFISGSETVTPPVSTTYLITCHNNFGQATDHVDVIVNQAAPTAPSVNLTATPQTINQGQAALLVWSSSNSASCSVSGGWTGLRALSGSENVSPTANTSYTITCTGPGGTAADTETVFVNTVLGLPPTPPPAVFNAACVASPSIVQAGRTVTFVAGKFGGTAPFTYAWSGDITGSGEAREFVFNTAGTKTARLKITDAAGRVAEANCPVRVTPRQITQAPPPPPKPAKPPVALVDTRVACETKIVTTCSDGRIITTPVGPAYTTSLQGTGIIPGQGLPGQGGSTFTPPPPPAPDPKVAKKKTDTSLFASLFLADNGKPSRFTFLLVWYLLILITVGIIAFIYTALKRRGDQF